MSDIVRGAWTDGGGGWSILVHGGAGDVPEARRAAHADGCRLAAEEGAAVLAKGGSALDAVQAAVELLEDDVRFNAGTGGSLDEHGDLRLDASIMDGSSLAAGAVATLSGFQHPIAVAREVLRDGRHVLYAADGAAAFARMRGIPGVDPASMITDAARERLGLTLRGVVGGGWAGGTVGAVARDAQGHVAAATSTGGTVGKRAGRVGDSPVIGAGTYADDLAGAFSGTGDGEGYLRAAIGARACFWLEQGTPVDEVARRAIVLLRERVGATGGVILVDREGKLALARSTATMSWAARWNGAGAGAANAFSGCLACSALRSIAACRPIRTRPRRDIFCFDRGFASHS